MQRDAESVRGLAHGLGALGLNLTAAQVNRLQELAGKDVLRSIVGMQARAQAAAESPKADNLHIARAMPSSPAHPYKQKPSHAKQHCVNSRKSMRNFKNLSAEVSGVLKDGSAASASSTLTSRLPSRPRNMSSNDSGPVRALLRPGDGPSDPTTEHLLTPNSPRKRAVPASAKAAFMGKCSKNLIHYESVAKSTPKQIMDWHCKTNIESPNHAQTQGRRRVKTSIVRKITSRLLDTYGEDVSRLQDLFHEADSANKRHLGRADFQRVLSERAGLNLASKDLDVLARAYQGDNRSEIHYDRLLDDLAQTARAVMPDTSVHQVNGAHRRRLAMQRMFGPRLLAASQGNPRLAFSSCKGGDGRVTGASILAHLERNLGMQVSAGDRAVLIEELKRAAPRASATGLNESAFSKVVLGQCEQPVTHALWEDEAKFDTRAEFRQPRDLEQARVAAKLRDWAECRRHSLRDVYLQVIDRDRNGPLSAEKAVANLSRLGLSLSSAETQTLQRLIATNSGTCTFDSFAKPMASEEKKSSGLFPWQPRKSQPALVSSVYASTTPHVEQSAPRRAHATLSTVERQDVHETKTEQQEKSSDSTRESKRSTRHAIACVKTRRKSVNSAYLLMKQGQPLPAEDLYQRLCETENASLDRADFDATLRSAGIAPSCPDIRFNQFNRLLAMDIKPEFSKSNDNPPLPPPPPTTTTTATTAPPPSPPRTKVLHLRAAPPAPGIPSSYTIA